MAWKKGRREGCGARGEWRDRGRGEDGMVGGRMDGWTK